MSGGDLSHSLDGFYMCTSWQKQHARGKTVDDGTHKQQLGRSREYHGFRCGDGRLPTEVCSGRGHSILLYLGRQVELQHDGKGVALWTVYILVDVYDSPNAATYAAPKTEVVKGLEEPAIWLLFILLLFRFLMFEPQHRADEQPRRCYVQYVCYDNSCVPWSRPLD